MASKIPTSFYDVLECLPSATVEELGQAWRRLAKKWHPDLHVGVAGREAEFKLVSMAWSTLRDPGKRRTYDLLNGFDQPAPATRPEPVSQLLQNASEPICLTRRSSPLPDGSFMQKLGARIRNACIAVAATPQAHAEVRYSDEQGEMLPAFYKAAVRGGKPARIELCQASAAKPIRVFDVTI